MRVPDPRCCPRRAEAGDRGVLQGVVDVAGRTIEVQWLVSQGKEVEAEWQGRPFLLVDTGGWLPGGSDLDEKVSRQSERAIGDADAVKATTLGFKNIARIMKLVEPAATTAPRTRIWKWYWCAAITTRTPAILHVNLRGRGRQSLRLPCFAFCERGAILPAFTSFTGGGAYTPGEGDRVFAIVENEIIQATTAAHKR